MKKIIKISLIIIISFFIFSTASVVLAAKDIGDAPGLLIKVADKAGVKKQTIPEAAGGIITIAMSITTLIFFILMVYAGFKWMLAQGEEEKIKKARDTLIMASIGLVVLVSSYAISIFLSKGIIENEGLSGGVGGVDDTQVCCLDQVKAGSDDYLEVHFAHWAWRVTTQSDCERRGNDPNDPNDALYGPGTWESIDCEKRDSGECATMCEEIWEDK